MVSYFMSIVQISRFDAKILHHLYDKVPSARLTLHSTKLCTSSKFLGKIKFFGTKVTSEAFLSISQILKVTRLQEGTQTKL
jgi:hypothetical protein